MQLTQPIRKFFTLLLIVALSLKAGTGLYLHDYFHIKNNFCASPIGSTEIKYACTCITDFYLPFTEISQQKIVSTFFPSEDRIFFYASPIFFATHVFYSLRAPPSIIC